MREKILNLKLDTTQVLRDNSDAVYLTEHDADQILKEIAQEIEKVENPFEPTTHPFISKSGGFKNCRNKILALLKP